MARKREIIEPNKGDKRFARRDAEGRFTEDQTDVGRSLSADRRDKSEPQHAAPLGRTAEPQQLLAHQRPRDLAERGFVKADQSVDVRGHWHRQR